MTAGSANGAGAPRWGAAFVGPCRARFALWAPDVARLGLRLGGVERPMARHADGWFEITRDGVEPGTAYGFVLPDGRVVPDPASRAQAGDVHGYSLVVDSAAYAWRNAGWTGRPWREAVLYELHVGAFTPEGTFRAAAKRLRHLADLGVTAVELMPVAQFSGSRGWGYDGVLPYAPHPAYGRPDDLRAFVDEAHGLGLMVLLDVVYNHFGPDGNYLPAYASRFFEPDRHTPWGAAIAHHREPVRRFFIDNALYWLEEFRLDGLRLDAIDHIRDPSDTHVLVELARTVRERIEGREIHLTTEDNRNVTDLHRREDGRVSLYTAEWNDDLHNAAHVILSGETEGYYGDFAGNPVGHVARCLAEGFAFQGEVELSGKPRGHPSGHLPPTAFIDFLQNHDQIGNRALGERLSVLADGRRLEALTAVLLLSPHIPLLFMGEEWGETAPFCFFTDFHGSLADAVREGRRREFAHFRSFGAEAGHAGVPDPNALTTFAVSRLDWTGAESPEGRDRLAFHRELIGLRREHVVPLLDERASHAGRIIACRPGGIAVDWTLAGARLQLRANLTEAPIAMPPVAGRRIYPQAASEPSLDIGTLPAWGVLFSLDDGEATP